MVAALTMFLIFEIHIRVCTLRNDFGIGTYMKHFLTEAAILLWRQI